MAKRKLLLGLLAGAAIAIAGAATVLFGNAPAPSAQPTAAATATARPIATSTPAATSTARPTVTLAPVSTPQPQGDILPAVNLQIEPIDGEANAFILHWDYPDEGSVAPDSFDIYVEGGLYESTDYQGTNAQYSWYVGEQPCSGELNVYILAVNGASSAQSETVRWAGC